MVIDPNLKDKSGAFRIERYQLIFARVFVGKVLTPQNTSFDRQELARFADWVRNDQLLPLVTVKYPCGLVGYYLPEHELVRYSKDRDGQRRELEHKRDEIALERAALAAEKFFTARMLDIPEEVLSYADKARARSGVKEVIRIDGDPVEGTVGKVIPPQPRVFGPRKKKTS